MTRTNAAAPRNQSAVQDANPQHNLTNADLRLFDAYFLLRVEMENIRIKFQNGVWTDRYVVGATW
jgi:hypothetical protein